MEAKCKIKLDNIIQELSSSLERDFSSQFRNLSNEEDRQLFFLAKILTRLKQIANEDKNVDRKVVRFPVLQRIK